MKRKTLIRKIEQAVGAAATAEDQGGRVVELGQGKRHGTAN